MSDATATAVSKQKPKRKIVRAIAYGFLGIGLIALLSHFVWVASGSNQWELDRETDGIKLWTLKSPGSGLLQVKGEARINSRLSSMAMVLEEFDDSAEGVFYYDGIKIREVESMPGNKASYARFKFDFPVPGIAPREYILLSERFQDPKTKKYELNLMAAPNMLPRDPCCVRVTHLHNNWKLTPLKNGELHIEFTQDTDDGGLPYLVQNLFLKEGTVMMLQHMRQLMKQDKYAKAQIASIQELDGN
jgi:hypothetical protein